MKALLHDDELEVVVVGVLVLRSVSYRCLGNSNSEMGYGRVGVPARDASRRIGLYEG
jgi:hypothetical protein